MGSMMKGAVRLLSTCESCLNRVMRQEPVCYLPVGPKALESQVSLDSHGAGQCFEKRGALHLHLQNLDAFRVPGPPKCPKEWPTNSIGSMRSTISVLYCLHCLCGILCHWFGHFGGPDKSLSSCSGLLHEVPASAKASGSERPAFCAAPAFKLSHSLVSLTLRVQSTQMQGIYG